MAKRLKLTGLRSVSLVDKGDNKGADVLIHKRADAGPDPDEESGDGAKERAWLLRKLSKLLGDGDATSFNEAGRERDISDDIWELTYRMEESLRSIMLDDDVTDKTAMVQESLDQFIQAVNGAVPVWLAGGSATKNEEDDDMSTTDTGATLDIDLDALPEEAQDAFKALMERVEELAKATEAEPAEPKEKDEADGDGDGEGAEPQPVELSTEAIVGALREALKAADEDDEEAVDEAVAKALDGVEKRVAKAEERADAKEAEAEELAKRLDAIEKANRREKFIKMASELKHIPNANADDLASVLDKIEATVDEDEFEQLSKLLRGADEAAHQMTKQVGADGELDENSATAELQKRANAQREADPKLTAEEASAKVLDEDPELRERVLRDEETNWRD